MFELRLGEIEPCPTHAEKESKARIPVELWIASAPRRKDRDMQMVELQAQVGRGEYQVDPGAVAAAIVRRLQEFTLKPSEPPWLRRRARSRPDPPKRL